MLASGAMGCVGLSKYARTRALQIFEAMMNQGLPPDVLIYSAVISACDNAAA